MASKALAEHVTIIPHCTSFEYDLPTNTVRWNVVFDDRVERKVMPEAAFRASTFDAMRLVKEIDLQRRAFYSDTCGSCIRPS